MPEQPGSITPAVAEAPACLECGRSWLDETERWRLYLTWDDPPEKLLYCTACATREFD
jgi:hypothetical protein